jgi:hypothetical protein
VKTPDIFGAEAPGIPGQREERRDPNRTNVRWTPTSERAIVCGVRWVRARSGLSHSSFTSSCGQGSLFVRYSIKLIGMGGTYPSPLASSVRRLPAILRAASLIISGILFSTSRASSFSADTIFDTSTMDFFSDLIVN